MGARLQWALTVINLICTPDSGFPPGNNGAVLQLRLTSLHGLISSVALVSRGFACDALFPELLNHEYGGCQTGP